jgi:hypothetical protein
MAVYPDYSTVPQHEPYEEEIQFRTLISNFDDLGEEQRKQKWLYPKRVINVKHMYVTKAQGRTIWEFYKARGGAYEAFNYFVPEATAYTNEYVGTGDGVTTAFNLPCKDISSRTVYINGSSVGATIATAAGSDGADLLRFGTPPTNAERITISFTGRLKVHCRFAEDNLSFEALYNRMISAGVKLQGLLNE